VITFGRIGKERMVALKCRRCESDYAPLPQINDLIAVERSLG
jgi:hypothetical protein